MTSEPSGRNRPEDSSEPDPQEQDELPRPEVQDGTVPAKQIHRWKGEGGALHRDD